MESSIEERLSNIEDRLGSVVEAQDRQLEFFNAGIKDIKNQLKEASKLQDVGFPFSMLFGGIAIAQLGLAIPSSILLWLGFAMIALVTPISFRYPFWRYRMGPKRR